VIGQALGTSIAAKLIGGALLTVVGAFLTAPGRHHRRRIVAVALLAALLHALRQAATALAAGRRKRPRRDSAIPSWAPASWAAVGLTAVAGFALGSGVTTVRGGWTDEKDATLTIPDVRGVTMTVARRTLVIDGFRVTLWNERANAPKRIALRTEPAAGSKAEERSTVKLIVSSGPKGKSKPTPGPGPGPKPKPRPKPGPGPSPNPGPPKVTVPAVEGLSGAAARAKLRSVGFDVTTFRDPSESIPENTAVGTDPSAGTRVRGGSRVKLIVSSGLAATLIEVPDVAGLNSKEAWRTLRIAQLTPSIEQKESELRAGTVIGTRPAARDLVPEGSPVTVLVSSGTSKNVSCDDFADQEEAQRFFKEHSSPEERDPYGLDPDENGIACG
jgi:beta-lactam-binding protein with PASTA domain